MQIAIDFGGTSIKAAIVDAGTILLRKSLPADSAGGLVPRLPVVAGLLAQMIDELRLPVGSVEGVGLAFPGPVDATRGRVIDTNGKFDDAPNVDFREWARSTWNLPMAIDNDARLACVGEWAYGAGRGYDSVAAITLGTGVGTGVIVNRKILRGAHFQAGSLGGHVPIDISGGRSCTCGNVGCSEAVASTWAFRRDLAEMPRENRETIAHGMSIEEVGLQQLFREAQHDNPEAVRLTKKYCSAWGATVVALIHAYDPEVVVVGGGVASAGEALLTPIREYVQKYAWMPAWEIPVLAGELPDSAALLGAAYLVSGEPIDVI